MKTNFRNLTIKSRTGVGSVVLILAFLFEMFCVPVSFRSERLRLKNDPKSPRFVSVRSSEFQKLLLDQSNDYLNSVESRFIDATVARRTVWNGLRRFRNDELDSETSRRRSVSFDSATTVSSFPDDLIRTIRSFAADSPFESESALAFLADLEPVSPSLQYYYCLPDDANSAFRFVEANPLNRIYRLPPNDLIPVAANGRLTSALNFRSFDVVAVVFGLFASFGLLFSRSPLRFLTLDDPWTRFLEILRLLRTSRLNSPCWATKRRSIRPFASDDCVARRSGATVRFCRTVRLSR